MMKAEKQASGEPIFSFCFRAHISNPKFWLLSCVLVFLPVCSCRDTITFDSPILDSPEDFLVSEGRRFQLGFFTPDGSPDARRRYVGIWDYGSDPKSVVWVANREPVSDRTGLFHIANDGNLAVSSKANASLWSTSLEPSANFNRTVRLTDSGNLMVIEEGSRNGPSSTLWQSFKNGTTNTFLPGMLMGSDFRLISWKGPGDPGKGNFVFEQDDELENQYLIKNLSYPYWKSGTYQDETAIPKNIADLLSNEFASERNITEYPKYPGNFSNYIARPRDINNSRVRIDFDGEVQYLTRDNSTAPFSVIWSEPRDYCSRFNPCGNFGSCNIGSIVPCKCLPGFEQTVPDGCRRKSSTYYKEKFLSLKMMKARKPSDDGSEAENDPDCMNQCSKITKCQAYSFIPVNTQQRETGRGKCWMWYEDLTNIQEDIDQGLDINVRIAIADIEPLKKSCGTCGTNIIPYPLSDGSNCGNPSYSFFNCSKSTGRLYFQIHNNKYRVIRVDEQTLNFTIQLNSSDCTNGTSDISSALSRSLQFYIGKCNHALNNLSSDASSRGEWLTELEIRWKLPSSEPPCDSSDDCLDWPQTTCNTTGNGTKRCLCISNLRWNFTVLNCTESQVADNFNQPSGGGTSSHGNKLLYLIFLVAIPIVIVSVGCFYNERRKTSDKQVKREQVPENLAARLYNSERRVKEWISSGQFGEDDKKDIDVPFFDLEVIMEATGDFSDENKLGRGGFGPVYKGKFPGGQEIAVKRLLSGSGQGLEEFKSEVMLIAKLQHRNLVRLLGYCVEGDEKMLLYEYMPNKSLDSFLFDQARCALLTWEMRLEIILGIARGMLYLHQDSRLRIIHRDLKTSNVLLDEEMNPKISDFGLARIFEGKQTEASTQRVMGTYGYMSPEYALDGFFSIKSDVFSFGVVVLEIISGKRNTGIYLPEGQLNLLNHAWRLWTDNNAMDLTDPVLEGSCNRHEVLKCINVALLCVQEDPNDRPTMSNVLFMLGGEIATVPAPKKPAFALKPSLSSTGSSSTRPDSSFTISSAIQHGR